MSEKLKGTTLWFDVKKGFGFIRYEEDGKPDMDYFVHYSKIEAPDGEFKVLEQGDKVLFEPFFADRDGGSKKPQAKNIEKIY